MVVPKMKTKTQKKRNAMKTIISKTLNCVEEECVVNESKEENNLNSQLKEIDSNKVSGKNRTNTIDWQ